MSVSWQEVVQAQRVTREQRNFWHLYLDIAGFGVLNGSAIAFAGIFAARQGASALQLGLLSAAPAIVTLMSALPVGRVLHRWPISRVVFWTSVAHRFFYLLWALIPWLFPSAVHAQWLLIFTFAMSVPGAVLAISFNGMFAAAVPAERRGHVVGIRNALFALASVLTSLLCGYILDQLPSPQGYQVVFGLGFLGAVISSYHLWFVRPAEEMDAAEVISQTRDWARPGTMRTGLGVRNSVGLRVFLLRLRGSWSNLLQLRVWRGRYGLILTLLFAFHLAQFIAIPLLPLYFTRELQLSDQAISWGNGLFYLVLFLVSTQLSRVVGRWGNQRTLAAGALIMGFYPLLVGLADGLPLFYAATLTGGIGVALMSGAVGNYLLEHMPADDRPPYLAWYNLALNAAVLSGSLIGPALANNLGLGVALLLAAGGRFLTGWLLWRYG